MRRARAIGDSGEEQELIRTICAQGPAVRRQGAVAASQAISPRRAPLAAESAASGALPPSDRPAIAVLPFVNMSGEAEQEYFSDGISEDIITALSKLRWFFVIARNSSFSYKGKAVQMKQIAEELGVGYVVEGSVRKDGERVRITVQLIDVTTGSHLWAERYDRNLADVFAVQDEITDAIVAAIEPQLYAAENFRARRKAPESLDAWDLVMRALSHFWRMTREDNLAAQKLLEQAIAIDPNYAQALAVLAVSRIFGVQMGWEDPRPSCRLPSAQHWPRSGPTGRIPGRMSRWRWRIRTRGASRIRWPSTKRRYASIRASRWRKACYALVLSWGGRSREGAEAADRAMQTQPARSILRDLLWRRRLRRLCRARLCRGDPAVAREHQAAQRFRRRLSRHYRRRRHGRRHRAREIHAAGVAPGASQCFAGLGREAGFQSGIQASASISWKVCAAPASINDGR